MKNIRFVFRMILLGLVLLVTKQLSAQRITLEECLTAAEKNYPLSKNHHILENLGDYNVENAFVGRKPQVNFVAQASYQSDVTRIPIDAPSFKVPVLSKDQYRSYLEINQSIFDGGATAASIELQRKQTEVDQQNLEVDLYKLRDRVAQLFFGALLTGRQVEQSDLLIADFDAIIKKLERSVQEGVVLKMSADQVRAERIRALQRKIDQTGTRKTYLEALTILTGISLNEQTTLTEPEIPEAIYSETHRPEMILFAKQSEVIQQQLHLNLSRNKPKAGFFLQAGYGRPGLNMLVNEFDTYYLTGIRFNWNFSGYWNLKNDHRIAELRINQIAIQKEIFQINNRILQRQFLEESSRLNELIHLDQELIVLRNRILETVQVQLENGVVTATDYLRESNAMDQARLSLLFHQIQRTQSAFNHRQLIGD